MKGGLVGQSTSGGMSGSPPRRHAPRGAFAPSSIGPGTRMMQRLANCASLGAHSPNPATWSALSNSDVFDHIIVSCGRQAYSWNRPAVTDLPRGTNESGNPRRLRPAAHG